MDGRAQIRDQDIDHMRRQAAGASVCESLCSTKLRSAKHKARMCEVIASVRAPLAALVIISN